MILVSACLLGHNCKYNGGNNFSPAVLAFLDNKEYISFCPECAGGLPTPRDPAERNGRKIVSKAGKDVTEEMTKGANAALQLSKENNIKLAVLKEKSPSCGVHQIYDGTFCGHLIAGKGLTTELLEKNGLQVMSELEIEAVII